MSTLQTTILKHPDSTTNNIRFDSSGRVGFGGADTPVGVVTIYDSTSAYLYFQNSASGTSGGDGFSILHHSSLDTFIANRDSGDIVFETGSSEAFRINSDGQVGIGASSFSDSREVLRVQAASGEAGTFLTIKSPSNTGESCLFFGDDDFNEGRVFYQHNVNALCFSTDDDERLRITSDGVVKHTGLRDGGGENKLAQYVVPSHNTAEEDVLVFQAENESSSNQLTFGGGTSTFNAATKIRFCTAENVDTTQGTEQFSIDSIGRMAGHAVDFQRVLTLLYARLDDHSGCSAGGPSASFTRFDSGDESFATVSRTTTNAPAGYSFIGDGYGSAFTFFVGCGDNPVFGTQNKDSDASQYNSWVIIHQSFIAAVGGLPTNTTRTLLP